MSGELIRGPVLIVSPHFDDAALGCSALLDLETEADVLTVFGGEPATPQQGFWDLYCGFRSSAESMPIRRAEERSALGSDTRSLSSLTLLESQYVDGDRPESEGRVIGAAITRWLATARAATVALPAGAGRSLSRSRALLARLRGRGIYRTHPDHEFVRDAALKLIPSRPGVRVVLYEELPYLWGGAADHRAREAATSVGRVTTPFELQVNRVSKAARISAYASQVPYLCPASVRLDDPDCLPAVERYWRLDLASETP